MCAMCGSVSGLWIDRHGYDGSAMIESGAGADTPAKPSKDVNQAVDALLRNYGTINGQPKTITYAYRATAPAANDGNAFGDITYFQQLNSAQITFMEGAFDRWEEVARITFSRQYGANGGTYSDTGTLLVGNYTRAKTDSGGFAGSGGIWLNNDQDSSDAGGQVAGKTGFSDVMNPTLGSSVYEQLYIHEVGHWVGLSHPGDYDSGNGVAVTYANQAAYLEDARLYTVMSYFGPDNVGANWFVASGTPMIHDIAAAQRLYGANTSTRTGDTTYGFNSNTGINTFTIATSSIHRVFTIWDAAGNDTIDMSGYSSTQTINLAPGSYSSTGGQTFNLGIAFGATIENVKGGSWIDTIYGNEVGNVIYANAGNDVVYGNGGVDAIYGGAGNDFIDGGSGGDFLYGDGENDTIYGGADGDTAYGGTGNDYLDGGSGFDKLYGGSGDDRLYGQGENDTIEGGAGKDTIDGGAGIDKVSYEFENGELTLDLGGAYGKVVVSGSTEADTLYNIEDVDGTRFDDTIVGSSVANSISGLSGNDTIYGVGGDDVISGNGGNDLIDGGTGVDFIYGDEGFDTVTYASESAAVTVDMAGAPTAGKVTTTTGTDTLVDVEAVIGSNFNDRMLGSAANNTFYGGLGADSLEGANGYDSLHGGDGADTLRGGEQNDTLDGGAGIDLIDGGNGIDLVSYASATGALTLDLVGAYGKVTTNTGIGAESDTLVSIENVDGTNFNDQIFGNGIANSLRGLGGNDTIYGLGGDDVISGNLGNDFIDGGTGVDFIYGDEGIDTVTYASETAGVTVDMAGAPTAGKVTTATGTDTVVDVEIVIGSGYGDRMRGEAKANTFYGGGGVDTIEGFLGDDTLQGGAGNDLIYGGEGSDTADFSDKTIIVSVSLAGAAGSTAFVNGVAEDTLYSIENLVGGSGADSFTGDASANRFFGGAGNDYLRGMGGADTIDGGTGTDAAVYDDKTAAVVVSLKGAADSVVLVGGLAEDTLRNIENVFTGSGADWLTGDEFDNAFISGDGNDTLMGGGGRDVLNGGGNTDTVDYSDKSVSVSLVLMGSEFADVFVGGVFEDNIVSIENVIGGSGDDVIFGDGLTNTLSGGAGNDRLFGGGGGDLIDGGAGVDTLDFRSISATLMLTLDRWLTASSWVGGLFYGYVTNIENVWGGAAGDVITGDLGVNLLRGGGGADTLDGGGNRDTVDYSDKTDGITVVLKDKDFTTVLVGGVAEDTIRNIESVIGGSGSDRFTGDGYANVFTGGAGDDIMFASVGIDTFDGEGGIDTADYSAERGSVSIKLAGATTARVTIGGVVDDLLRNVENVVGGRGADMLTGDQFANLLSGGSGDDVLAGLLGMDTLDGGAGIDTASFAEKGGSVVVTLKGSQNALVSIGGVDEDTLRNIENVIGGRSHDTLIGDGFANRLEGGAGNDFLAGRGGLDVLDGGIGIDTADYSDKNVAVSVTLNGSVFTGVSVGGVLEDRIANIEHLIGGRGADTLVGDGLANRLDGGLGADVLAGGAGIDTFVFSTALGPANVDRIVDFAAQDVFNLSQAIFGDLALGTIASTQFKNLSRGAIDADDRILYNAASGALSYDVDGSGAAAATTFAILANKIAPTYVDFVVI